MQLDIISFCKGVFEPVTEYEQTMSHKSIFVGPIGPVEQVNR